MNKPVLVLVMSEKCGACQNFKRKMLPDLERDLNKNNSFDFVVLDFPEMVINGNDVKNTYYHPELKNGFVEFFPTFLLFPGDLWYNRETKLKGVPKHNNTNVDYSKSSIISWINDTVDRESMFSDRKGNSNSYVVPTYGTYNKFKSTKIDDNL